MWLRTGTFYLALTVVPSVISDKCGRRHAERVILAQSHLASNGSEWITRRPCRKQRTTLPVPGYSSESAGSSGLGADIGVCITDPAP
jgi:hypothetical protein